MNKLENEAELDLFLQGFLNGTLPTAEWTHEAHIVMATCMLQDYPLEEATTRIREGIKSYNIAAGGKNTETEGYHETLTIFWIQTISGALRELDGSLSRLDKVRSMAGRFGTQRDLFKKYWSFDVVKSTEARQRWVEPDVTA